MHRPLDRLNVIGVEIYLLCFLSIPHSINLETRCLSTQPTLGVAANGAFYYVADSQGGKFLKSPDGVPESEQREVVVLKVPLEAPVEPRRRSARPGR